VVRKQPIQRMGPHQFLMSLKFVAMWEETLMNLSVEKRKESLLDVVNDFNLSKH